MGSDLIFGLGLGVFFNVASPKKQLLWNLKKFYGKYSWGRPFLDNAKHQKRIQHIDKHVREAFSKNC